jgi:hypothetical protein
MVNPESPTFKVSEKIGRIIGIALRYAVIGSGLFILGGLFKKNKPSV